MLREFGVADVRVQEVVSLDDEMLSFLPYVLSVSHSNGTMTDLRRKPVYGLVFLFQFKEDDPSMQEPTCPDHIWFANQVCIDDVRSRNHHLTDNFRLPAMPVLPLLCSISS
jgi:ubiquitin carboxyl-terminal hydrolase L5